MRGPSLSFVDLFAGCGGLSAGLFESGWGGHFGVEYQSDAYQSLAANFLEGGTYRYDWPEWLKQQPWEMGKLIRSHRSEIGSLRGQIGLVAGGPPCQGFSCNGKRESRDPRNQLFRRYVDFVRLTEPPLLLLENVPGFGIVHGKLEVSRRPNPRVGRPRKSYAQRLRELLEDDYWLDDCLVRSSDFGVPQVRPRYFAVGVHKSVATAEFTEKSGWAMDLLYSNRTAFLRKRGLAQTPVTARQALSDLEHARSFNRIGPHVSDGTCRSPRGFEQLDYGGPGRKTNAFVRLMRRNAGSNNLTSTRIPRHTEPVRKRFELILDTCEKGKRLNDRDRERLGLKKHRVVPLSPHRPAQTVTTLPDDLLHYSEPRILTVRESARLQSFADWFQFRGKYTTGGDRRTSECPRYTQVGNAIPPLVAAAWGEALMQLGDALGIS